MTLTAEERARRALVDAASLPIEERARRALMEAASLPIGVAHWLGIGIRSEGRRALNARLERETKGKTHRSTNLDVSKDTGYEFATVRNVEGHRTVKKSWSPLREACSIVAIFSQRGDDKVWRINVDKATRQERKAARALIRFEGGKVGVK